MFDRSESGTRFTIVSYFRREAGINPLSTGILSDIFPEKKRALVMSVFNWGIYGGYGIAFPVGRYIPKLNIAGQVSHLKKQKKEINIISLDLIEESQNKTVYV